MSQLISIITPAYRARDCLPAAVRSALAQDYEHFEMLIVADDDEDYEGLLRAHNLADPRLHFLRTGRSASGPNVARNVALAVARGQWLAPLDADDVYFPARLSRLLVAAADSGLALDNVKLVGENLPGGNVFDDQAVTPFGFEDFKSSLVPLLFLFRRDHVLHGWDEDVVRGADTLFNLRALESAGYAGYEPEALHEYRVHGASMCHAAGAEDIFDTAYTHTLERLRGDGLHFNSEEFRQRVINMIEQKQYINQAFQTALGQGFSGNYQSFVETFQITAKGRPGGGWL